MTLATSLAFLDALLCCGLAGVVLLWRPRSVAQWFFVAGMVALAADAAFVGLSLQSLQPADMVDWFRWRLVTTSCVIGAWWVFAASYSRGDARPSLQRQGPLAAAATGLCLLLTLFAPEGLFVNLNESAEGRLEWLGLGWSGVVVNLLALLSAVAILLNLERTLRAAVGTMRWRIKYMVLGLALLFGVRVYTHSQTLLFSAVNRSVLIVGLIGLFLGCGLIAFSLFRSHVFTLDLYPSQAVLQGSLTVALVGTYLLVVGVLAKTLTLVVGESEFPFGAFLLLTGAVGLGVLSLSERLRRRTRAFVSRHFHRPLYDYRKVWSAFTEQTTSLLEEHAFCRAVARLFSETFNALTVTIWLVDTRKPQFTVAASTGAAEPPATASAGTPEELRQLIEALRARPRPVDLESSREHWVEVLQRCNPRYFPEGGHRVCVPFLSGGELLGLVAIGDRVSGVAFEEEDLELLQCIADQVAASLNNMRLSQSLLQAKELEAFQTMAAFFVHDLKNTASTLSLMLQNMAAHFDNPAFREDARRSLARSVDHLNGLIERLTQLRQGLAMEVKDGDLLEVVRAAMAAVKGAPGLTLIETLEPLPAVRLDPVQLQKVFTNLLLNARDALGTQGEVRVATRRQPGWAVVAVSDTGCGMTPEFLARSLFKPFQTSKKNGLGIGMFHSKMIVEAHRGKIEVESAPGQGTTFRVLLPLPT
jgi:putative PEP-CTERM system histidine kinase